MIGDKRIDIPGAAFFEFFGNVYDNPDGKEIVDIFKGNVLGGYFSPDGIDGFGSAENSVRELEVFKDFMEALDEFFDIIAAEFAFFF